MIQFQFNWNHVSVIAGLTRASVLFRLHDGSFKKEQVVDFLQALRVQLKRPLLILWDSAKYHRSALVRHYLESTDGRLQVAFLPSCAPDLDSVNYLWAWLKYLALAIVSTSNMALRATNSIAPSTGPRSSQPAGPRRRSGRS